MSCCPRCHFRREEREIFPKLPPHIRACLAAEHERLEKLGFPPKATRRHAETEMLFFEEYAPECCAWVEDDHSKIDAQFDAQQARAG